MSRTLFAAVLGTASLSIATLTAASTAATGVPVTGHVSTPSIADAQSASDEISAHAIALAYKHPVTVDSLTTESGLVSALSDGTMQLVASSLPVRIKRGDSWVSTDASLALTAAGSYAPIAASTPVEFSAGGNAVAARIQTKQGQWVTESWPLGALPAPQINGATATYPEVLPGIDLQLTATASGMSEVLVVKTPDAAKNPRLASIGFDVSGAAVSVAANGAATATTAASGGVAELVSGSPQWWDSSQPGSDARGPGGRAVPRPVGSIVKGQRLGLATAAVVESPSLTFPLYIDPDWSTPGPQARTFVDSAYPTQTYYNGSGTDGKMHVGYVDAANSDDGRNHTTRSFWQMDSSAIAGRHILAAHFDTTLVWSFSCTASSVEAWLPGTPFGSGTSWNNQPAFSVKSDTQTVAAGYTGCPNSKPVGFNVFGPVGMAASYGWPSLPVELKATNEGDHNSWKKFTAAATMTVTYNTAPNTPTALAVSPCGFTCGGAVNYSNNSQPVLSVTGSDPDGNNIDNYFYVYAGQSDTPGNPIVTGHVYAASGGRVNWQVASALADGPYEVRSVTSDGVVLSPWSGFVRFTVDKTPPPPPALSATGPVSTVSSSYAGVVGKDVEQVTLTPGAGDTWGYMYGVFPSTATPVFPVNVACGTTVGAISTVCQGSTAPVTVSVTPPDENSKFAAISFDAAGNVGTSAQSSINFYAKPDFAAVNAGHSWPTAKPTTSGCVQGVTADTATVPKPLTVSGLACAEATLLTGQTTTRGALSFDDSGYVSAVRYNSGPDHALGLTPPSYSYRQEASLGLLLSAPATGASALYSCFIGNDEFTSTDANCEGYLFDGLLGYIYTSQPTASPPTVALYRCFGPDHFVSLDAKCEGRTTDFLLGYLVAGGTIPAYVPLTRYIGADHTTSLVPPPGYNGETPLGYLLSSPVPGSAPLYSCQIGGDQFTSAAASCEGQQVNTLLGYVYASPPAGGPATIVLQRCAAGDHFDSLSPTCEGQRVEGGLGYVIKGGTATTSEPVIDTTKSFTVGAWLKIGDNPSNVFETAMTQDGSAVSGFFLMQAFGRWQFCVPRTESNVWDGDGAVGPPAAANTWTFVVGTWDAINHQIRIYASTDGSASTPAVAYHPSTPASNGPVSFGLGHAAGHVRPWRGSIASPFVFQGVMSSSLFTYLGKKSIPPSQVPAS